jgi:hypothetical protein
MSSLVLSGDTSGAITLAAPAVAGTNTATLPAATGTVMVSGNMPAFSAYANTTQSISTNTYTKITINTENFDTANAFDSTTNYRFTPLVAGYYQINGAVGITSTNIVFASIYKNGSEISRGEGSASAAYPSNVCDVIYLNGSTDYVELWGNVASAASTSAFQAITRFSGVLVRAA